VLGSPIGSAQAVRKPTIPSTEKECVVRGGHWQQFAMYPTIHFCVMTATDADKSCTDSSQCQGTCLAASSLCHGTCSAVARVTTKDVHGQCSSRLQDQGCVAYLDHGVLKREPCY